MARRKKSPAGGTRKTQADQAKTDDTVSTGDDTLNADTADSVQDAPDATLSDQDTVAAESGEASETDTTSPDNVADDVSASDVEDAVDTPDATVAEAAEASDHVPDVVEDTIAGAGDDDTLADKADPIDTDTSSPAEDPSPAAVVAPPPQVIKETTIQRKGGFVPMVLGGVVAAGLGYGASEYLRGAQPDPFRQDITATVETQGKDLGALTGRVDETAKAVEAIDLAPLSTSLTGAETAITGLQGSVTSVQASVDAVAADLTTANKTLADLGASLTALDVRLTALEKRPVAEAVGPEVIQAYERELTALQDKIAEQQKVLDTTVTPEAITGLQTDLAGLKTALTDQQKALDAALKPEALAGVQKDLDALKAALDDQQAQIATVATNAETMRDDAAEKAAVAEALTAVAEVTAAVTAGSAFAEPLAKLTDSGIEIPEVLSANADGSVPALPALTSGYPPLARQALAAARKIAAAEGGGGVSAFFANSLGARSVTPQEGSSPDAILSRAEAAVKSGDLTSALGEISELPSEVSAPLADWVDQVKLRQDALAAAAALAQNVSQK